MTDKLNYKWISDFKYFKQPSNFPQTSFRSSTSNDVGLIIGSTVGSIAGIFLLGAVIFFGRKFYKKRDIIRIAGGNRV